jgi:hypothetical protein
MWSRSLMSRLETYQRLVQIGERLGLEAERLGLCCQWRRETGPAEACAPAGKGRAPAVPRWTKWAKICG